MKEVSIGREEYTNIMKFVMMINQQMLDLKRDVQGTALTNEQLQIVESALKLAKIEFKLLQEEQS